MTKAPIAGAGHSSGSQSATRWEPRSSSRPRERFPRVTGFRAGGPHQLEPGEWTDDTSMALALGHSIVEAGWDLNDQARRYLSWWQDGVYSVTGECFDIGGTTAASLRKFRQTGDAWTCADPSPHASGNGSIMRLAPVPIAFVELFPDRLVVLAQRLVESSRTTHASPQCLSACAYLGVVLCGLMNGLGREEVLDAAWEPALRLRELVPLPAEIVDVARGGFRSKRPPEIKGSGYVVRSLEAALWALHDAADFREAVLRAVNLGDDADTTAPSAASLPAPGSASLAYPPNGGWPWPLRTRSSPS